MTTIQDVRDFAVAHGKERNWNMLTAAFFYNALDLDRSFATVNHARTKSHILSNNSEVSPAGAFHWWSGPFGQVGLGTEAGDTKILTVSAYADGEYGPFVGYVANVKQIPLRYLGWSLDYAGQELVVDTRT